MDARGVFLQRLFDVKPSLFWILLATKCTYIAIPVCKLIVVDHATGLRTSGAKAADSYPSSYQQPPLRYILVGCFVVICRR